MLPNRSCAGSVRLADKPFITAPRVRRLKTASLINFPDNIRDKQTHERGVNSRIIELSREAVDNVTDAGLKGWGY